jgi:Raf kinase inhibitor-like YbhB/YbcL family protein
MRTRRLVALAAVLVLSAPARAEDDTATLRISADAYAAAGAIPTRYTCEGDDVSPALHWSGVPSLARSLVLILDDPDAPDPEAPRTTWVHWVLYDLPPATAGLPEAVAQLPEGTREGLNDWGHTEYGGPCPPIGRHRYFHKLYALDTVLGALEHPTKSAVEAAMRGHVLAQAQLIGTYEKRKR